MKEENTMFYQAIGNSIQANKDKIEKLEKQNERLKKKNKSLQSQLKAKEEAEKEFIKYLEEEIEHNTPRVRWKHYNEDGFNDYDVENGDYIEAQPVNITLKEVISKYKEILSKGENK